MRHALSRASFGIGRFCCGRKAECELQSAIVGVVYLNLAAECGNGAVDNRQTEPHAPILACPALVYAVEEIEKLTEMFFCNAFAVVGKREIMFPVLFP